MVSSLEIRCGNRLNDSSVPVRLFQVPMALGANQDGVELGAAEIECALRERLRARGFDDVLSRLCQSQEIPVQSLEEARQGIQANERALYVDGIADACERLAASVSETVGAGQFPLILGGDHALSIGSIAGASSLGRLGVVWIDAHGDINTPDTTPSRHVHGMPLAASLGYGPPELVGIGHRFDLALDDLVYIGVRHLDRGERELLRQAPSLVYTMESIDSLGITGVVLEAIRRLVERGVEAVHVSFDLDVLDPVIMPAVGLPAPGGLTYREAYRTMTLLRASELPIVSADVVELNPRLDFTGDATAIAVGLTAALLGEDML